MECSNKRGEAELIATFHLSPNEIIFTIARMNSHYFLYDTKLDRHFVLSIVLITPRLL